MRRKAWILISRMRILPQIPLYLGALFVVPIIRLLRSLTWVRFGQVRSDAIGHFVFDAEYYLSEREIENSKTIDCFYFAPNKTPNKYWALMVQRQLRVNSLFRYLDKANHLIPGGKLHSKDACNTGSRDPYGYFSGTKTHFSFTDHENELGSRFLRSIGFEKNHQFVCLLVRDSAYKDSLENRANADWSYHSFRDAEISDFKAAVYALTEKGYWVFRMGKKVNEPFEVNHPRMVDYAINKYRSEFLDIWLMANCHFAISTSTGLDDVANVFKRPIVFVNALPLGQIATSFNPNNIWLPKKLVWVNNKKQLTLVEQIKTGAIHFLSCADYRNANIEVVDNAPEEITKTTMELEEKLTGKWQPHPQDEELQNKFWEMLQTWNHFHKLHGNIQSKMPDTFLRDNHEWFLA